MMPVEHGVHPEHPCDRPCAASPHSVLRIDCESPKPRAGPPTAKAPPVFPSAFAKVEPRRVAKASQIPGTAPWGAVSACRPPPRGERFAAKEVRTAAGGEQAQIPRRGPRGGVARLVCGDESPKILRRKIVRRNLLYLGGVPPGRSRKGRRGLPAVTAAIQLLTLDPHRRRSPPEGQLRAGRHCASGSSVTSIPSRPPGRKSAGSRATGLNRIKPDVRG